MRAEDDLTYQEYKDNVLDYMMHYERLGWEPRQVTDWMTEEDNELLIGTSEALWIISIGAYEASMTFWRREYWSSCRIISHAMRWENTTTSRRKKESFWRRILHLSARKSNCGS